MRILHVIPRMGLGGAEKLASDLMSLQKLEHVTQLCVLEYSGSLRDAIELAKCVSRLKREIKQFNPDIIHAHLWPAAMICSIACITGGIRLIVHIHDMQPNLASNGFRDRVKRGINRILLSACDARLIAVSEAVKLYTLEHLKMHTTDIQVVRNGVAVETARPELPDTRQRFTIGAAGRLVSEKGLDGLIRAIGLLRSEGVDIHLMIAGEGSQKAHLEELTRELELNNDVTFLGRVYDMTAFYEHIDTFVLPSISTEGMPLTILEAMSSHLPVVATNIPGIGEVVEHDQTGLLVPPGNIPALANAIVILARNPQLCRQMGMRGRDRVVASFSCERMASEVSAIYRSLAA
ncbi:MAG TPA: glycosyltransferase family 4 protein [Tepidisphaeraceae bacterium]|nr:glycosyltransferase family 4 protein [Tepidisphaeraceae bacterium]